VLWPPRGDATDLAVASRGDNAASLVLDVGTGNARALLTADTDSLSEARLAARARPALLKAGHHGSASSSGAAFLTALSPACAILSCGVRNPYGHPAPGALARLAASGARADRTDLDGTLWYELTDRGATRLDWRAGEPLRSGLSSVGAAGAAGAARSR
jgi:competence protein ComEC